VRDSAALAFHIITPVQSASSAQVPWSVSR
jgi:hypothetical protein